MVNQTITIILEELLDRTFMRQATTEQHVIGSSTHTNPSNICHMDDTYCRYTLQLKEKNINLDTVAHLDLTKCSLTTLPNSLCKVQLKSLNLSYNLFRAVPDCIFTGLDLLENLNLSHNYITEFEKEPKCLLHLRILDLQNNKIQYIPIWFVHARSQNLQELYYSNNILGKTNESLYKEVFLYSINKMIMKNSCILNENIAFIKSIKTLDILDISNDKALNYRNCFTNYDDLFDEPGWKTNIKTLDMSDLTMGFLPNGILFLISLRELYLSKNAIYWLPDYIGNLVHLEILDLSNNSMCLLPNTITNLKKLRILNLQYNKLSNIQMIDNLSLEILDLYENELDSCSLNICKYNYLDLERNYFNTTTLNTIYIKRRDNYRIDFNLIDRVLGCCEEDVEITSSSSWKDSSNNSCDENRDGSNVTPNSTYEEECWDDERKESHPDITPSDDEWQGYMPKSKAAKRPKENLSHLLESLYVDVD